MKQYEVKKDLMLPQTLKRILDMEKDKAGNYLDFDFQRGEKEVTELVDGKEVKVVKPTAFAIAPLSNGKSLILKAQADINLDKPVKFLYTSMQELEDGCFVNVKATNSFGKL